MRKSVPNGPLPEADGQAPGEKPTDAERCSGASRRSRAEGEPGAGAAVKSSTGPAPVVSAVGSDDEATLNDAWLVERARHGDHTAFAVLVRRYERKLIRVLARLVRDSELARDLTQETFFRVYNRLERFDTARRFGPWLFRVGVNLGLDWLRRSRIEPAPPASIDRPHGEGHLPFELPDPDPGSKPSLPRKSSTFWPSYRSLTARSWYFAIWKGSHRRRSRRS